MRLLLVPVCLLVLLVGLDAGYAQVDTGAETAKKNSPGSVYEPAGADSPEQIRGRGAEWYAQCMQDWGPETHMTKEDWARTCRRVVDERVQWLLDQAKQ
jgi:hypothetical protein